MDYSKESISGSLLFIGSIQFILGIILSEALYPGYSTSIQTISSLGVGPSAIVFNSSILLLGILGLISVYFSDQVYKSTLFSILLGLAYVGAIGVGLFTEAPSTFTLHVFFSFMAYVFGGIAAITSYRLQKPPMSIFSVILGAFSLVAIILLASGNYLGLGLGGIERMVAYPLLLWLIGFGSQLISKTEHANPNENKSRSISFSIQLFSDLTPKFSRRSKTILQWKGYLYCGMACLQHFKAYCVS